MVCANTLTWFWVWFLAASGWSAFFIVLIHLWEEARELWSTSPAGLKKAVAIGVVISILVFYGALLA